MKPTLLLFLTMSMALHAQAPRFRDAATHDDLEKTHRQAQQADPMARLDEAKGPGLEAVKPIPGLISSSDILSSSGFATLIPKRAILNKPSAVADRVNNFQKGSQVVGWLDFYQNNRGWITIIEVTRAQAEGKEALDEKVIENFQKSNNLVVATYQGGPVSVMPPAEPEAKKTDSPSPSPTQKTDKP